MCNIFTPDFFEEESGSNKINPEALGRVLFVTRAWRRRLPSG